MRARKASVILTRSNISVSNGNNSVIRRRARWLLLAALLVSVVFVSDVFWRAMRISHRRSIVPLEARSSDVEDSAVGGAGRAPPPRRLTGSD